MGCKEKEDLSKPIGVWWSIFAVDSKLKYEGFIYHSSNKNLLVTKNLNYKQSKIKLKKFCLFGSCNMDQAEQIAAESVESEICECRRHTCNLSTPRVVQTFEVLDAVEGRTCYRELLIACIILLLVIIILVIILRSIF